MVTLTDFARFGLAQGQSNSTSSSLTPEQKDAICNPNNPSSNLNPVNTTEKICGIPKTVKPPMSNTTTTTTPDTTITTETEGEPSPDTSIAPSAVP